MDYSCRFLEIFYTHRVSRKVLYMKLSYLFFMLFILPFSIKSFTSLDKNFFDAINEKNHEAIDAFLHKRGCV